MNQYTNVVWDELENFDAFGIDWIQRSHNGAVDLLANIALRLDDITFVEISKVEAMTRSPILDNIENWKFFKDD